MTQDYNFRITGRKTVPKTPVREKIEALKTGGHYEKRTSSSEFSAKEWKYKMDLMTSEDKANADLPAIIVIGSNGVVTTRNFFYWRKYGGTEQLTIYNNTDTVNAVKVKCSDNNLYRITPPLASLDKQETLTIKVHRTFAPIKPDRILVLIVPTEQTSKEGLKLEKLFKDPSLVYDQVSFTQGITRNLASSPCGQN
ncbi:unnamed protein product [Haemonchus placei]|uniref:Major sperm protein n=1 Tax=Haemonchus placei TaxID=6290 RepID=A0A0N4X3D5_HAEPC|nr:unnamed protein product [Haemonchus placei]